MLFQSRTQRSTIAKVRDIFWPRIGWRRAIVYYWYRLHRIPDSAARIAAGFACGAAMAMTPLYGTHMVLGAIMAWIIGGNMLAAVIGAHVANPWTAPPLWYGAYYLGQLMLRHPIEDNPPNFIRMFRGLTGAVLNLDGSEFMERVWPVFWPMTVGSIPMAIVSWIVAYFVLESVLKVVHLRRAKRTAKPLMPPAGQDV